MYVFIYACISIQFAKSNLFENKLLAKRRRKSKTLQCLVATA